MTVIASEASHREAVLAVTSGLARIAAASAAVKSVGSDSAAAMSPGASAWGSPRR